jgi:aerobic-type carbon monoxide dehydrogenase small subunit (CoxS/CutS family)
MRRWLVAARLVFVLEKFGKLGVHGGRFYHAQVGAFGARARSGHGEVWQPPTNLAGDDQPEDEGDSEQGQKLADQIHLRESNITSDELSLSLGLLAVLEESSKWKARPSTQSIVVNGTRHAITSSGDTPLLYVLRDELGLTGPKFGCGLAQCGACSVLIGGLSTRSCVLPVIAVTTPVTTLEGLGTPERPQPLQQAFICRCAVHQRVVAAVKRAAEAG